MCKCCRVCLFNKTYLNQSFIKVCKCCRVSLLNFSCFQKQDTGQILLDMTYNQLGVTEKEYFGLQQNETSVDSPVSIVNNKCVCIYMCIYIHTHIYKNKHQLFVNILIYLIVFHFTAMA